MAGLVETEALLLSWDGGPPFFFFLLFFSGPPGGIPNFPLPLDDSPLVGATPLFRNLAFPFELVFPVRFSQWIPTSFSFKTF